MAGTHMEVILRKICSAHERQHGGHLALDVF